MGKLSFFKIFNALLAIFLLSGSVMAENPATDNSQYLEGERIYRKLEAQELSCSDLEYQDFLVLGEYFLEERLGNASRGWRLGAEQMEQTLVFWGQTFSGCREDSDWHHEGGMMHDWGWGTAMFGSLFWFGLALVAFFAGLSLIILLGLGIYLLTRKR